MTRQAVPLTDPRCTRFWLAENDATTIIWQALEMMPLEPLVPTLRAYLLTDLAEAMGLKWTIVGLRPGESVHHAMRDGESSETAPRMTVEELRLELAALDRPT